MKFKATIEFVYEIMDDELEGWYGITDPQKAAKVDENNFNDDPAGLMDMLNSEGYTVKVESVK